MFISLYTTRLVLNSLGAEDFGIFNIVGGAIAMLGFLNASMASATQRFMSYSEGEGDKEKQKKIFNISIVLHFIIALVLGIALLIAGYFFFNGVLNIDAGRMYAAKVVYGSLIISTIFTVMTVPYDAVLNAHENMKCYAIVGIIESVLKLGVALAVVYIVGDKLVIYGVLMAFIPLITMNIMRIYCHKHYTECRISPKKYWDKKLMKEMGEFAGWSLLGSMSGSVGNHGNGLVLNHFFGSSINTSIGIAVQLNGQLLVLCNNILKVVNPILIKTEGSSNRGLMIKYVVFTSKLSFYIFSFLAIPAILEAKTILNIWLKEVPEWSVIFFQYSLLKTLIEQLTVTFSTALSASGEVKEVNVFKSIINLIPIPILYVLFKNEYSPYYFYWVTILFMAIGESVIKLYFCNKNLEFSFSRFLHSIFFPCLIITITTFITGNLTNIFFESIYAQLILRFIITSFSLLCGFLILFDKKEKVFILNLVNSFIPIIYKFKWLIR